MYCDILDCGIMLASCLRSMSLTRGLILPHRANQVQRNLIHTAANGGALRKTFEPDYLDAYVSDIPLATEKKLNVQLCGYDFTVLESYQSFVHRTCENMGVDVEECWATPCRSIDVKTYQEGGTIVKDTYSINMFERNVQIHSIRSIDLPMLLYLLRHTIPEGVRLSVHEHEEEHFEARFIPDPFIDGIKKEISEYDERSGAAQETAALTKAEKEERKKTKLLQSLEDVDEDDEDY